MTERLAALLVLIAPLTGVAQTDGLVYEEEANRAALTPTSPPTAEAPPLEGGLRAPVTHPESNAAINRRVAWQLVGGVVGFASFGLAGAFATSPGCGIMVCGYDVLVALPLGVLGATVGVSVAGNATGGLGGFWTTLGFSAVTTALALAVVTPVGGFVSSQLFRFQNPAGWSEILIFSAVSVMVIAPIAGALLGYQLTHALELHNRLVAELQVAVAPLPGRGGQLVLAGTF